jgi:hypothetical protein
MKGFPPIQQSTSLSSRRKSQSPTRVSQSPSVSAAQEQKSKGKENIESDLNSLQNAEKTPAAKQSVESPSSEGR